MTRCWLQETLTIALPPVLAWIGFELGTAAHRAGFEPRLSHVVLAFEWFEFMISCYDFFTSVVCMFWVSQFYLQILNLAGKLCITNSKQTKLLTQYVFNLAKYDQNYDIRDRSRFLRALILPTDGNAGGYLAKHAKKILLATKPAPLLESNFKGELHSPLKAWWLAGKPKWSEYYEKEGKITSSCTF